MTAERVETLREAREAAAQAKDAYEGVAAAARAQNPSAAEYQRAKGAYSEAIVSGFDLAHRNVLCIIDTYSQTAEVDDRRSVSAYIKNLRALVEEAQAEGVAMTADDVDMLVNQARRYATRDFGAVLVFEGFSHIRRELR
jgi:hypothetical protein